MTFTRQVKEEIIHNCISNKNLSVGILIALAHGCHEKSEKRSAYIRTSLPSLIRLIYEALKELKLKSEGLTYEKNKTQVTVFFSEELRLKILESLIMIDPSNQNSELIRGYVAGSFLTSGHISPLTSSSYVIELQLNNYDQAVTSLEILVQNLFPFYIRKRGNRFIVYTKRSESISDVLKFLEATSSMYSFEDARIKRDMVNQLSRLNNIEISNQRKILVSSRQQIDDIKKINSNGSGFKLNKYEKWFMEIRIKNPDSSLADICAIISREHDISFEKRHALTVIRSLRKIAKSLD